MFYNKCAFIEVVRVLQTVVILASSNGNLEIVNPTLDWGRQCADEGGVLGERNNALFPIASERFIPPTPPSVAPPT